MAKRKAPASATGAGRPSKRSKKAAPAAFVYKPRDWILKKEITSAVSTISNRNNRKQLLVKKVLAIEANSDNDPRPFEVRVLSLLKPACNRVVKALFYSPSDADPGYGTALFEHYPLGDLVDWKKAQFDAKNNKPVPESFVWRFFLQISQALAFVQNVLGPDRDERDCVIHRDIKPTNVLVTSNGTTYPSFKLHDFGVAMVYQKEKAKKASRCGTFEWQCPENPVINTRAADIWSLGACVHYLTIGAAPVRVLGPWIAAQVQQHGGQHPEGAAEYTTPFQYYSARVPRVVTPCNLTQAEQRTLGIGPYPNPDRAPYNHQYSDELNDWMSECLMTRPDQRPTADRLVYGMGLLARGMLRKMGGKAALTDIDIEFYQE